MNKDQIAAKMKKLKQRIEKLEEKIAADTAAKKLLQKELADLEAAQIVEMIRSASSSASTEEVAQNFAEYLRTKEEAAINADATSETEEIL